MIRNTYSALWFAGISVYRRLYCYMQFDSRKREHIDQALNQAISRVALLS
jgi:hypothetical protein